MAAPGVTILKKYTRLRAIEVTLSEALHNMVTDSAVNVVAKRLGFEDRGEALYEHEDFSVLLELATYQHRLRGKTVIERLFSKSKPAVGTDEDVVLSAIVPSRFTLARIGETTAGVGVRAQDLLFGGSHLLVDERLSKGRRRREMVIATRLLAFDDFVMTPCTSFLDFEPELAQILAAGLPNE